MDDGISDSSGGSDDENTGDDDSYQRKKRRTTGDEDSEDEGFGGRPKPAQRHDWAKAPAFVSSKTADSKPKVDQSEVMDIPDVGTLPDSDSDSESSDDDGAKDEHGQEDADADDTDNDVNANEDDSEPSKAPSPRIRDEEEEEEEVQRPRFGGLGLGASKSHPPTAFSGFTKSGIGASRPAAVSIPATPSPAPSPSPAPQASEDPTILGSLPSAFGGGSRPQRSFVRNGTPQAPPPPKPSLSAHESAHFRKLEGTFGARMLAKMGWQAGTGLGTESQGIVAPIETKVRPKNMGIAFKGFSERTEQSRAEARRRGEVFSDDEEEGGTKKGPKGREDRRKADKSSDAWRKPKKVKTKVKHKTYEQIVAEVGEDTAGPSGLGVIIDATGATVRCSYASDYELANCPSSSLAKSLR